MTRDLQRALKDVATEGAQDSLVIRLGRIAGARTVGLKVCVEALRLQEKTILALGTYEEWASLVDGPPIAAMKNAAMRRAFEDREIAESVAAAAEIRERGQR